VLRKLRKHLVLATDCTTNQNIKPSHKSLADMIMFRFLARTLKVKIADTEELTVDLIQEIPATLRSRIFGSTFR